MSNTETTTLINVDIETKEKIREHVKIMKPKSASMKHFIEMATKETIERDTQNLKQLGQQ